MHNNQKKPRMNFWILIIVIIVVDLLFLGYNAIKKHNNKSSQASTVRVTVIANPTVSGDNGLS